MNTDYGGHSSISNFCQLSSQMSNTFSHFLSDKQFWGQAGAKMVLQNI